MNAFFIKIVLPFILVPDFSCSEARSRDSDYLLWEFEALDHLRIRKNCVSLQFLGHLVWRPSIGNAPF